MKNYYKRIDGKVFPVNIFDNIINVWGLYIVELVTNVKYERIYCSGNYLKNLYLPDSCKVVDCHYNQIKELIIPDGCEYIEADMKSVTELNKVDKLRLTI